MCNTRFSSLAKMTATYHSARDCQAKLAEIGGGLVRFRELQAARLARETTGRLPIAPRAGSGPFVGNRRLTMEAAIEAQDGAVDHDVLDHV